VIRVATGAGIGLVLALALAAPATEAAPVTIDFTGLASGANIVWSIIAARARGSIPMPPP
jgi:hypothetical protein